MQVILGKVTSRDAVIDQELAREIASCSGDVPTVLSGTMCTDEFYEGIVNCVVLIFCLVSKMFEL